MLTADEGRKAVMFTRNVVEQSVKNNVAPSSDLEGIFSESQGAFVTLHTYPEHELRGCIGIPLAIMPLKEAIVEAAKSILLVTN